jgi:hypothetical protein
MLLQKAPIKVDPGAKPDLPTNDENSNHFACRRRYSSWLLSDAEGTCVITVFPPDFRTNMLAKKKHRELRRIIDEDIATEPTSAEK